jgi:hypothetical protein
MIRTNRTRLGPVRRQAATRLTAAAAAVLVVGCGAGSHPRATARTVPSPTVTALPTTPSTTAGVPSPSPERPLSGPITAQAFGMHYFGFGRDPYPLMPFGTARVWDTFMTWKDLQPTAGTSLTNPSANPTLQRLDGYLQLLTRHGVQPMITLGMTPAWAAYPCHHMRRGVDWGIQTCAPADPGPKGPWAAYVRALAERYHGKVRYFELWNEPMLHNGYNDSVATLARMQQTAYTILHRYGDQLVSPSVPFTAGDPSLAYAWMNTFFHEPGGKAFDIVGLHLYPSDDSVRGGYGPEWVVNTALAGARQVLAANGLGGLAIWNTETNVGRIPAGTILGGGAAAAAGVARTFVLNNENQIARTIWYGPDERNFGGTWLEDDSYSSLTTAGLAYLRVRSLLLGKVPLGCNADMRGANQWNYTCRFAAVTGRTTLLVMWTTGPSYRAPVPAGTARVLGVTGKRLRAPAGTDLTVTHSPLYLIGSFD